MRPAIPFLYFPDAVTLLLLLTVLGMLRSASIGRFRQELLVIRKEMLIFWVNNGLNPGDAGFRALRDLLECCLLIAPELSPGRLLFLRRLQKKATNSKIPLFLRDPSREVRLQIARTADAKGQEKLKRLQTETGLAVGTFCLVGSVSGWFLSFTIVVRMLKHIFVHCTGNRTDFFFDMLERVLGSLGMQSVHLLYAIQKPRDD